MSVTHAIRATRYLLVLLRWLLITLVVFVLTVLGGAYITDNILHKVYTANAQIEIRPNGASPPLIDPTVFQAEFEVIESPEVLLPIIKDLGLDKAWSKKVYEADSDQLPDVDALTRIQKMLRFDVPRGTNIINITVSSDVPQETAAIANAVAYRYKTMRDAEEAQPLQESPVRILSRAEVPTVPTHPNKHFAFIMTIVGACFLSLTTASFVEIIFLFLRAAERMDN